MKMKKLTSVALAAALAIGTFGFSVPAKATEQTTTTTDYVLTIPADFDVTEKGWKYAGDIAVAQNASFDTGKKITVSAASAHEFRLTKDNAVTEYGDNYVRYDICNATGAENTKGDAATSWEFSADAIKADGGAKQGIGVNVEDYTTKNLPAGNYTDTVTFTAKVENAVTTRTVTWNASDITDARDSFTKDGITITAQMIDDRDKNFAGPGTFTTESGKFTKIEVTARYVDISGTGWSGSDSKKTWTGDASSSVSYSDDIYDMGIGQLKIVFTIEE